MFSPMSKKSWQKIWLKGNQPDHQILAGLHPRVQPKRLTILAAYLDFWEGYPVEEYGAYHNLNVCVALASCITTFASSPHSNRFNELRLKGFHLIAQSVPPPILHSLRVLVLKRVTVDTQVLADILSDCHQLEELQLLKTCLTGSSQPLAVLSNLPLTSLALDIEETSLPEGQQPLAFLQHLSPSLTTLDLHLSAALASKQESGHRYELPVFSYIPSHLKHLKHLTTSTVVHPDYEERVLLSLAGASVPEQLETLTLNCMEMPDMQCAVTLLSMPKLRLLAGDLWFSEDRYDTPATGVVPWPQSKPAMELQIGRAGVKQLAALPLEHFSSVNITWLDLGGGSEPQEGDNRVAAAQALLAAARKCPSFSIAGMCAGSGYGQYPLMPALCEVCPIRLNNSSVFECDELSLDDTSVLGIAAAWGPQLRKLILKQSVPESAAWPVITPATFPMLEEIELFPGCMDFSWVAEVTLFCMEWPPDRKLQVRVTAERHEWSDMNDITESLATQVQHMLKVRAKHNIRFKWEWHREWDMFW